MKYSVSTVKGARPCPKCGGKAPGVLTDGRGSLVFCWDCSHSGRRGKSEAEAAGAWNRAAGNRRKAL